MRRLPLWLGVLALVAPTGCQLPEVAPASGGPVAAIEEGMAEVTLHPTSYQLLATMTAYRQAVHHVTLNLYRGVNGTFETQPIATVAQVLASDMAKPITLSHLKLGQTYKVEAIAYDSAGTVLSEAAGSQAVFTMPSVGVVDGTARVARSIALRLPVDLKNQTFPGQATYQVRAANGSGVRTVTMSLKLGTSTISSLTHTTVSTTAVSYPLSRLRMGKTYTLTATATVNGGRTPPSPIVRTIVTPTVHATTGVIDTTPLGPYTFFF